jgi:threonine aldolase
MTGDKPMIDLRSDTVTLPTDEMREAMRRAELGDDSREGDPTVRRLEKAAAAITGKDAALFVASGTMSNLVALLAHTGRGGEVLLDGDSHIMRSEMGGIASLAGLFYRPVPSTRGAPNLEDISEHLTARLSANKLSTALVCVETTHNSAGGAVLPLNYLARLRAATGEKSVPVHIDGARIFNAAVALGVPAAEIARHGDSIGFCVSKGLSAPFGSVLCGSAAFIERARAYRRMVGGGMRQAGVMAAAGLVGLERMVDRLADDHRRAKRLAEGLHAIDPRLTDPRLVETNIVMVEIGHTGTDAMTWRATLEKAGVSSGAWSRKSIRLVTHRHIDDAAINKVLAIIGSVSSTLVRSDGQILERAV